MIYGDGNQAHPAKDHLDALQHHHAAGKGLAVLHWALEPSDPKMAAFLTEALGGRFETDWSVNPIWKLQDPLFGRASDRPRGAAFAIEDECYFHLRMREGVVPVLRGLPPVGVLGADGPYSGNRHVRAALGGEGAAGAGVGGGERERVARVWVQRRAFSPQLVAAGVAQAGAQRDRVDGGGGGAAGGVAGAVAAGPANPTIDVAIARGDLEDVKRHVAADAGRLHRGGAANSRPPLAQAILRNRTEIALYLLGAGADPNVVGAARRAPLHLAVERHNPVVVRALLKAGANPNAGDQDGWTPLHHAAARNQLETARALLDGGADPMTLSALGGTPLHEAAASGGAAMIRLLLEHKVDPKLKSKEGVTALDVARQFKNQPAIKLLEGR